MRPLLVLAAAASLALSSCTVGYDPATGAFALAADPAAVTAISNRFVERINERLAEEKVAEPPLPSKPVDSGSGK